MRPGPRIFGVVNVTEDSFSDGGRYLAPAAAVAHARLLFAAGADVVELGASSTHPDARPVPAELEIERLAPVLDALEGSGIPLGVDSFHAGTQRWALERGVSWLNDTQGFPEPESVPGLADASCGLVVMHSVQRRGSAQRRVTDPDEVRAGIEVFFKERIAALRALGVARDRLVLDPGMGFFLGSTPLPSLAVLRDLGGLRERFGLPLLVSVSRKSFLRVLTGRSIAESGAATLAAELFAAGRGVDYIRTHDPGPLRDGLAVLAALDSPA